MLLLVSSWLNNLSTVPYENDLRKDASENMKELNDEIIMTSGTVTVTRHYSRMNLGLLDEDKYK